MYIIQSEYLPPAPLRHKVERMLVTAWLNASRLAEE
jgi:hypothetical protein